MSLIMYSYCIDFVIRNSTNWLTTPIAMSADQFGISYLSVIITHFRISTNWLTTPMSSIVL
jgi:hypothetical protein